MAEIAVDESTTNEATISEFGASKVTPDKNTINETAIHECSCFEAKISECAVLILWGFYGLVIEPFSCKCSILPRIRGTERFNWPSNFVDISVNHD